MNNLDKAKFGEREFNMKHMLIYSSTFSICLNRGHEELVGNDDVSIVCARKYEMFRMT